MMMSSSPTTTAVVTVTASPPPPAAAAAGRQMSKSSSGRGSLPLRFPRHQYNNIPLINPSSLIIPRNCEPFFSSSSSSCSSCRLRRQLPLCCCCCCSSPPPLAATPDPRLLRLIPKTNNSKISGVICAPLMAPSVDQMLIDMHRAKREGADVAEIRLDCLINFQPRRDLPFLLQHKPLPIVVSFGPTWETSANELDEQERLEILVLAADLGADYIEVESKAASVLVKDGTLSRLRSTSKIIVSFYADTLNSLKDLNHLVAEMLPNADIIKIVSKAANITEVANLFDLLSNGQVPTIAFCTGERGLISQLLSFKYGGAFAYGSIDGNAVPGLPSIESLRQYYGVKNIDKDTVVFGLISKPVSHSKGPILHNPSFRAVGYNAIYVPMLVDDLKEFFSVYRSPEFAGFSVGIPYKEAVVDFCDEVHPLAQSIGAVNTIIRNPSNGKLVGYNTDCEAAITAIEDALKTAAGCTDQEASISSPLTGKLFVVVGAGGAGRAICFGAKTRGARVIVFDRNFDRAKSLAAEASAKALPFEDLHSFYPEKGAILANATPLGMHPNTERIPLPQDTLGDYEVVFDAVYTPRKTRLLMEAEAAGAVVVSGVEMFLRQAAAQFSFFTGGKAPEELMRQIILEKF